MPPAQVNRVRGLLEGSVHGDWGVEALVKLGDDLASWAGKLDHLAFVLLWADGSAQQCTR